MNNKRKKIAILGSTGSIGTQTLDIIRQHPELFEAEILTAGKNWQLLARQALEFLPSRIVINDINGFNELKSLLRDKNIEVKYGDEAIAESVTLPEIDIVVTAMVGYSGFIPTIKAIENGKTIALANKETLVVGGSLIMPLAQKYNAPILPVDSEHSAIFQCLVGEDKAKMKRIYLTASGGPFRTLSKEELDKVTVSDALAHPNWSMGAKVTIDSASMINKGFEMIEAKWLFNCNPEDIKVVVHPQSIVHSMVEFCDGSVKAQLGIPDMHLPIRYALGYPERLKSNTGFLNISDFATLTFEEPDIEKFPLLATAFKAIEKGGNMPCIMNAANETGVKAFLEGKIKFTDLPKIVDFVMQRTDFIDRPSLEDLIETNRLALTIADEWLKNYNKL